MLEVEVNSVSGNNYEKVLKKYKNAIGKVFIDIEDLFDLAKELGQSIIVHWDSNKITIYDTDI